MNTLEQRIAAALSDDDIDSYHIADLLAETEQASIDADKAAITARELALDPIASPDAHKARAAIEDANFTSMRLRTVQPRLQTKYDKVSRAERHEKWASEEATACQRSLGGHGVGMFRLRSAFVRRTDSSRTSRHVRFVPIPDSCAAAKATYSISSSARNSSDSGIMRPIAFAVLKLTINSNLVGCSIGRSEGLAPLASRSTNSAARR
jgi:hypothetical protein